MSIVKRTLDEDVFAAFERSCRAGEFEVAEHLLTALEAIARIRASDEQLAIAYLVFANAREAPDKHQDSASSLNAGGLVHNGLTT